MSTTIHAYAANEAGTKLEEFAYEAGDLAPDEVEIDVDSCGICHSDLSMLKNEWGMTEYPIVPGHEVSGRIAAAGESVTHLEVGQKVGLGWYARSCLVCHDCMSGNHNLCQNAVGTIVGRHGGFADKVRAQAAWVLPIPDALDPVKMGPLFCGGITVFNPLVQNGIRPTDRVGVIGIGGLGHMALAFLKAWGCEVTAFSTSPDKEQEARDLGAHRFINSKDPDALKGEAGRYDMILSTIAADIDWAPYIAALGAQGKLHFVGAAPGVSSEVFPLILRERSLGGSPVGSPATTGTMLEFSARHGIEPVTEVFKMSEVNEALDKLENGSPRYRIVLTR